MPEQAETEGPKRHHCRVWPPENGAAAASRRDVARQRVVMSGLALHMHCVYAAAMSKNGGKEATAPPSQLVGVAVKKKDGWYQVVEVRRQGEKVTELPKSKPTRDRLIAATYLEGIFLESGL